MVAGSIIVRTMSVMAYRVRAPALTEIPAPLLRGTYIEVAMDDKNSTGDSFMEFRVQEPVVLYVAYDLRCTRTPTWLGGWERTSDLLKNNTGASHLVVYRRSFPAGRIALGGNRAPGAGAMYSVVVQAGQ